MSARKKPAQSEPSVLDIGRQIVRLSNENQKLECECSQLHRKGLTDQVNAKRYRSLEKRICASCEREESLVDTALGMRAHTLGDVAVMLRLAWRVLDIEASSEPDGDSLERAFKQIQHAIVTSLDVVIKGSGLPIEETLGHDVQRFIDREHSEQRDEAVSATTISLEAAVTEAAVESKVLRLLLELAADMGVLDQALQAV